MHSYVGDSGGQCVRNGIRPQEAIIVFFFTKTLHTLAFPLCLLLIIKQNWALYEAGLLWNTYLTLKVGVCYSWHGSF